MSASVGAAYSMSLWGLEATPVRVEAVLLGGLPNVSIVGLADTAVNEARERLRASFSCVGMVWPNERLTVNLSPADTAKTGTRFDLAIAVAIIGALGYRTFSPRTVVVGELGLDGSVRSVRGVIPCVLAAQRLGYQQIVVPVENEAEARLISGMRVLPVSHLAQVAELLGVSGMADDVQGEHARESCSTPEVMPASRPCAIAPHSVGDLIDVYGQDEAIWALEVAAVGGHHVQLVGAPGIGKSMLASRFPGILPPLSEREAMEVAAVQSLGGVYVSELPTTRPFSAPHHTSTTAALVGGGRGVPQPGAITYAHHGVLFCDEFPEFSQQAIQALRQPMETGWVDLHRVHAHVRYPAHFQLIAAANPCRCGHALDGAGMCVCKPRERATYRSHLGGPIRDRFDIRLVLRRPSKAALAAGGQVSSAQALERVLSARARAQKRLEAFNVSATKTTATDNSAGADNDRRRRISCNAELPGRWLREHTPLSGAMESVIDRQVSTGQLSLRGLDRVLRLSWSVADMQAHATPTDDDLAMAFTLRGEEDVYGD